MTVTIATASRDVVKGLISQANSIRLGDTKILNDALIRTQDLWVGWHNDEPVFAWGLIPPTLLSSSAYLWMVSIDEAEEHQFVLVRHSQIAMKQMLECYGTIVGHCEVGHGRSIRWLKWLGATFGSVEGTLLPFTIVRKEPTDG